MSCVDCQWLKSNRIIINPDGQVIPCCFFANILYTSKQFNYPKTRELGNTDSLENEMVDNRLVSYQVTQDPILAEYIENESEMNLMNNSMSEILEHKWFHMLYDSWNDSDKVSRICLKHCGV